MPIELRVEVDYERLRFAYRVGGWQWLAAAAVRRQHPLGRGDRARAAELHRGVRRHGVSGPGGHGGAGGLRLVRPQAFPQSNMVVLVDTDAGITGIGQGGSPDTVRNVARSVIGRNAFDTEMIWQAAYMDGFYARQGTAARTRRHRPGLVGHQREGAERPTLPAVRRQGARAHRALCDLRSAPGPRAAGRSRSHGVERPRGRDDGGRLSGVPRGRSADIAPDRRAAPPGAARGRGTVRSSIRGRVSG